MRPDGNGSLCGKHESELALVIACAAEMGLPDDCAEICIWREACRRLPGEVRRLHRDIMPGIVERIRRRPDSGDMLREMYFSKVIPVAAAMEAGELRIARWLYIKTVQELADRFGEG